MKIYQHLPKSWAIKYWVVFYQTQCRIMIQSFKYQLVVQLFLNLGNFISLPIQNCQNYAALSHGNLAVETFSKIVSTIQNSANTVSVNIFKWRKMFKMSSVTLYTYSCQSISKTIDRFVNWTCPIYSPVRLLIQKLFWASDEGFKIAS